MGGLGRSAGFLSRRNLNRQTGFGVAAAVREPVIQTSMRRSAMSKEDHGHAKHARLLELEAMVRDARIYKLVVAITAMQGRLMGKRVQAEAFLAGVIDHGARFCTCLLGT